MIQLEANHQGSKVRFRDFRLTGPFLVEIVEKVLPKEFCVVPKLNTSKTQILPRKNRKYSPENYPEDDYREAQWQIRDMRPHCRMTYIPLLEKKKLENQCLILFPKKSNPMPLILTTVIHQDHIPSRILS